MSTRAVVVIKFGLKQCALMLCSILTAQISPNGGEAPPEESPLAARVVEPVPASNSLANHAPNPPKELKVMAHFRSTGTLLTLDTTNPGDRALAVETAEEWFSQRNLPLDLAKHWRSFEVDINYDDRIEAAKFRREGKLRKLCYKVS